MSRLGRTASAALAAGLVLVAAVVARLVWGSGGDATPPRPGVSASPSGAAMQQGDVLRRTGPCGGPVQQPFAPKRISIAGVTAGAPVVGVPRDGSGVPGVLPTSEKSSFAWDLGGIEPGDRRGNVLLNAHTWPDGTALGNAMLKSLDRGDRIVVTGEGQTLCYRVARRIEVLATDGYRPYYATRGPPQLAFVVCSGERTGPGQWTKRTIWFARPMSGG